MQTGQTDAMRTEPTQDAPTQDAPTPVPHVPAWVGDLAAMLAMIGSVFASVPGFPDDHTPLRYVVFALWALLIPLRHWCPRAMLALSVAGYAVAAFAFPLTPATVLPAAIGVYTLAAHAQRRTSLTTPLLVGATMASLTVVSLGSVLDPFVLHVLVVIGFAAVAGEAVRVRRAYVAEITARAVRAEQTREAEASRRVAEDRLRIARDLHDAVAHQITVISLHAGVASSSLDTEPEVARESLLTIRGAARLVLGEIGDLLATLRSSEDAGQRPDTPGLAHLGDLIRRFEASGLEVDSDVEGDIFRLSAAADVVAYRVIQEALTNALRHGTGRARVSISVGPSAAELLVLNPIAAVPAREPIGTGHGLAGVAERVASVRGQVSHGADGGVFRLAVSLPTSHGSVREGW